MDFLTHQQYTDGGVEEPIVECVRVQAHHPHERYVRRRAFTAMARVGVRPFQRTSALRALFPLR
jgi:hypothetical protein